MKLNHQNLRDENKTPYKCITYFIAKGKMTQINSEKLF